MQPTFDQFLAGTVVVVLTLAMAALAIMETPIPDAVAAAFTLGIGYVFGAQRGASQKLNGELNERLISALMRLRDVDKA